ncbi:MAG: PsbP-related protein [Eubacteriales bacterium]
MKKTISIICLIASLVLVLTACSNNAGAPDGFQNVASERESFYLYVPNGWISNTSGGTASAYYSTDDRSNMSFTCLVIDPDEMDELEEYKAVTIAELGEILSGFSVIEPSTEEEAAELKIDGRETIVFEYKCTLSGKTYRYKQAVTMKDDFFYIFTYTALEENYDAHLADVDATISNIKFK